jgi:hypothetical protein
LIANHNTVKGFYKTNFFDKIGGYFNFIAAGIPGRHAELLENLQGCANAL